MKKNIIIFFMMISLCNICFAFDPFLGWNCKNNEALKAAIARDNKDVNASTKTLYALMIAENENPSNVNTLAKCVEIVRNVYIANGTEKPDEDHIFSVILQYFYNRNDKTILKDIIDSSHATKNWYFKENYVANRNWVNLSDSEYRDFLFEHLKQKIKTYKIDYFNDQFQKYIELCAEYEDSIVIKELQTLYRMAIPKLSTNENMKPIMVVISLALKGYGVEVK